MKKYAVRDREAGNIIDMFDSYDMARIAMEEYYDADEKEGIYVANFYEIVEL